MRSLLYGRGVLAVVCLAVWTGAASAQTGRVGGLVRDDTGNPIKSAIVSAEFLDANVGSITATTDDKGRFAMVGLRFGEWTFRVQAPGFAGQVGSLNVRTGGINPPMTFSLTKTTAAASALGSVSPADLQSSLETADALFKDSRWDEAIAAYRAVLAQAPALYSINLQIAAADRNKKDLDGAIVAYEAMLKADPNSSAARIGIAMTSLEKGDTENAERTLLLASQNERATREVFYDLGDVQLARSKVDDAVKAYSRAVDADATWGKPRLALGRIAMNKGDTVGARRYFQAVVDVDPVSAEAAQATTMLQQLAR
jgi:Flp pilus assembly protein TadD